MNKKSSFPLRMDENLMQWVKEQAQLNDRSMNAELARMVRKAKELAERQKAA